MLAGENIDAGLFFFSHWVNDAVKWTLKQVQGDEFLNNQRRLQNQCHPELVSGSIGRLAQFKLRERGFSDSTLGTLLSLSLKRASK
jgi:hypothetical protein